MKSDEKFSSINNLRSSFQTFLLGNKINMYSFEESFHRYLIAMGCASERVIKGTTVSFV